MPFLERSYSLGKTPSVTTFICPTRFMHRDYGEKLREFLQSKFRIIEIVDFSDIQIFDAATNYTGLFTFGKPTEREYRFQVRKFRNDTALSPTAFEQSLFSKRPSDHMTWVEFTREELSARPWYFGDSLQTALTAKLRAAENLPLRQLCSGIFQGISTGKDEVFIINSTTIDEWNLEPAILKRMLKGKDIRRYSLSWSGHFVVYPYDEQGQVIPDRLRATFPNTYRYLQKMRPKLSGRAYFENSTKRWYELLESASAR